MANLDSFLQLFVKPFVWHKKKSIIAIALIIGLFFLLRGCGIQLDLAPNYNIGRDPRWESMNLLSRDRSMTAFSDNLLLSIGKEEKMRMSIHSASSNDLIHKLRNDEYNGILSNIRPNPQNQQILSFSEPYFLLGPVLVLKQNSKITSFDQLHGKFIGIQSNGISLAEIRSLPFMQISLYDNPLQALVDLDGKKIDGVILPSLIAYTYTRTFYEGRLKVVTPPLTNEGLRLISLKGEQGEHLVRTFNEGLQRLKDSGEYEELLAKWGLTNTLKPDEYLQDLPPLEL